MLRVWLQNNVDIAPDGVVHRRWLARPEAEEWRALQALRACMLASSVSAAPLAAQRAMSAGEQYGRILANDKVRAQFATTSRKAFSAVSAKMDVLVARRPRAAH
jgi:hypothetical protein